MPGSVPRPPMSERPSDRSVRILEILDLVYAAALDPRRWPEALAAMAREVQGSMAIEWRDPLTGSAIVHEVGGDLKFLRTMLDEQPDEDVRVGADPTSVFRVAEPDGHGFGMPGGRRLSMVRPGGWRDTLVARLSRDPADGARLCVARSLVQSDLSLGDRHRLERLAPHIARAIAIARSFQNALQEIGRLEVVLDVMPAPILLARANGQLTFMNRAARAAVAEGDLIGISGDRLCPRAPEARQTWAAAFDMAPDAFDPSPCRSLVLKGHGGRGGIAHVLDLDASAAGLGGARPVARAVVLVRPREGLARWPGLFESMHGLSPAEARVLAVFAEAGGIAVPGQGDLALEDVARRLAISRNTAKTHLQRLFEKTGTQRQSELLHRYLAWRHVMPEVPDGLFE